MSPANRTKLSRVIDVDHDARAIREIVSAHKDWFISIDGRSPLSMNADEFDFSVAHGRLMFSSWTENGSRTWRISAWNWNGEKLLLDASRKLGAENSELQLVPHASAKAIVANIAAARQERCEKLAQIVSQFIPNSTIERAA